MRKSKRRRLAKRGWIIGSGDDWLELTEAERRILDEDRADVEAARKALREGGFIAWETVKKRLCKGPARRIDAGPQGSGGDSRERGERGHG